MGDVFVPLSSENSVTETFLVKDLVERMQLGPQKKYLVVRGRRLLGVISLNDIISYISLENEFGRARKR